MIGSFYLALRWPIFNILAILTCAPFVVLIVGAILWWFLATPEGWFLLRCTAALIDLLIWTALLAFFIAFFLILLRGY